MAVAEKKVTLEEVLDRLNKQLERNLLGDKFIMEYTMRYDKWGEPIPYWVLRFKGTKRVPVAACTNLDSMDEQMKLYFKLGGNPEINTFKKMNEWLGVKYKGAIRVGFACKTPKGSETVKDMYIPIMFKLNNEWYVLKEAYDWANLSISLAQLDNVFQANGMKFIQSIPGHYPTLKNREYDWIKYE